MSDIESYTHAGATLIAETSGAADDVSRTYILIHGIGMGRTIFADLDRHLDRESSARTIAIDLPAGTALDDHEVHEGAWLVVAEGRVRVAAESQEAADHLGPGGFAAFDPGERRDISAIDDARILLLLTPWPAPDRRATGAG